MSTDIEVVDEANMKRVLLLAKKAAGKTFPNPMVGAVIVKQGKIIGQGYHKKAGAMHAEIEAIRNCRSALSGGTLYVNLEPCTHYGRTPPCVETIIKSGISRVVCCTSDPNPNVGGDGIKRLREAGVSVTVGILAAEAEKLNEAFFSSHRKQRPFIAIKFAASLDGKIATHKHDSKWITNEKARAEARKLRSQFQAVVVGVNTVINDNPRLGTRVKGRADPMRIILDSRLRTPLKSQVLRDDKVLIITTSRAKTVKIKDFGNKGIPVFVCPDEEIKLPLVMKELARREIISIFVEGGGSVLGSFLDEGFVDKVYAFYGPLLIGGKNAVGAIGGRGFPTISHTLRLTGLDYRKFEDSILISGYPEK